MCCCVIIDFNPSSFFLPDYRLINFIHLFILLSYLHFSHSPARRRQLDYVEVEKEVVSRQIKEISLASNNLVSTGINYTVTVRLDGITFKSECGT